MIKETDSKINEKKTERIIQVGWKTIINKKSVRETEITYWLQRGERSEKVLRSIRKDLIIKRIKNHRKKERERIKGIGRSKVRNIISHGGDGEFAPLPKELIWKFPLS